MKITEDGKEMLEVGDKIHCKGFTVEIAKIVFQEYWGRYGFITEFYDTNGTYRNWNQFLDGGYVVERKEK